MMVNDKYILINNVPVKEPDILKWGECFKNIENRRVALTELPNGYRVSTVFLGLDHNFGDGSPLLFGTMVFKGGSSLNGNTERYGTWKKAEAGHTRMVEKWEKVKSTT